MHLDFLSAPLNRHDVNSANLTDRQAKRIAEPICVNKKKGSASIIGINCHIFCCQVATQNNGTAVSCPLAEINSNLQTKDDTLVHQRHQLSTILLRKIEF